MNRRDFVKMSTLAPMVYALPRPLDALKGQLTAKDPFADTFVHPSDEYRPCIFWDWVNDLISKKGITSDLEQFKRIGLSGTLVMLVGTETEHGQMWGNNNIPHPIVSQTPEFFDVWKFAAEESHRLGLTIRSQCGPGWCHSGGPWIKPEQAVQHIAYSELQLEGNGQERTIVLSRQTDGVAKAFHSSITAADEPKWITITLDQQQEIEAVALHPFDNNGIQGFGFPVRFVIEVANTSDFSDKKNYYSHSRTDFPNPEHQVVICKGEKVSARYIRIKTLKNYTVFRNKKTQYLFSLDEVEVIVDGVNLAPKAKITTSASIEDFGYTQKALNDGFSMTTAYPGGQASHLVLLRPGYSYFTRDIAVVAFPYKEKVQLDEVIDLSGFIKEDTIQWTVPKGKWLVRRFAMRNALAYNRHPPAGGKGLECDKLDKDAVDAMFEGMIGKYLKNSPELIGKTIRAFEADSWEVGKPEWSRWFKKEFIKRRGYDPTKWMITIGTDQIIGSKDLTERFENDMYFTKTDLFADNFFDRLSRKAESFGMEFMTEPYIAPFDPIRMAGRVQVPMCEFWVSSEMMFTARWASSAANTYGRKRVAAEAFTGRWNDGNWKIDPYAIKRVGDLAFCNGVNHMFLHGTALQPWGMDQKPGMPMFFWGTMFAPAQSWWKPGRAWVNYISRCQYMLSRGKNVADVLGLMPTINWRGSMPEGLHKKYNYDLISEELFLSKLQYKDDAFRLPSGACYKILVLPKTKGKMAPAVISKVMQLVGNGGTVVCQDRPIRSIGLSGYPEVDNKVQRLAAALWGKMDGETIVENALGGGKLIWMKEVWTDTLDPERKHFLESRTKNYAFWDNPASTTKWSPDFIHLMKTMVPPDVDVLQAGGAAMAWGGWPETAAGTRSGEDAIAWTHRRDQDTDIYFISSQVATQNQVQLLFRAKNKVPEFWCPDTGKRYRCTEWSAEGDQVKIALTFAPFGSLFVLFKPKDQLSAKREWEEGPPSDVVPITNTWKVYFPEGSGAPTSVMLDAGSWSDHKQFGVKYFSGTATYEGSLGLTAAQLKFRIVLDLGLVRNLAEVLINGIGAGILWKPPFQTEVGHLLKRGKNKITLKVTNTWWNRMVGDLQLPEDLEWWPKSRYAGDDYRGYELKEFPKWVWTGEQRPSEKRVTFSPWRYAEKDSPLEPSGLIGPVKLLLFET